MPWKAEVTKDHVTREYTDVVEVVIGHFNFHWKNAAKLYLDTRNESIDERIRPGDSVTLTWEPELPSE